MGGMTIVPDCLIDDIARMETSVLLIKYGYLERSKIMVQLLKSERISSLGCYCLCKFVWSHCRTYNYGLLDNRAHTSNE